MLNATRLPFGVWWLIKCTQKHERRHDGKKCISLHVAPGSSWGKCKKWGLCTRCRIGCACMPFLSCARWIFPPMTVQNIGGGLSVCFWWWSVLVAVACLLWRCGCLFPSVAVSDHVKSFFCIQYTFFGNIDSVGRSGVSFRYLNTFETFRQTTARSREAKCLNCFELSEK